jgi:hypothetical protein
MSLTKRGSDNLLNGAIVGAIMGVLLASSSFSWAQSIVTAVTGWIPSTWTSWAGTSANYVVFGLLGGIIGYVMDYN